MSFTFKLVSEAGASIALQPPVVQLGRGPLLGVSDKRCSRAQLELKLNVQSGEATLSHHGVNVSRWKHGDTVKDLVPEEAVKVASGDSFSLLGDEHWFRLVVDRAAPPAAGRPPCIYGASCTRKSEAHRREYFHGIDVPHPEIEDDIVMSDPEPEPAPSPVQLRPAAAAPKLAHVVSESDKEREVVLAFPSFSTATYQFDLERAAQVAAKVITDFLSGHKSKFRLLLVTLDPPTEAAFKRHVPPNDRFAVVRADISQPRNFGAQVVANATNTTFSGGGSGVNKALHAADTDLEKNTHKLHGMHAEVGKAYVVPTSVHSSLAAHGVTHVIHVLGPNMNPERPLCLKGNYDLGCTLLAAAYTSLFNAFLQIKSSVVREMSPGPQAKRAAVSPTKVSSSTAPKVSSSAAPKGGGGAGGGGGWADVLMDYIRYPEKHQGEIVTRDSETIVIFDKFPKSKHHFLVMPVKQVDGFKHLSRADIPLLLQMKKQADAMIAQVRAKETNVQFRVGFHAVPSMRQLHLHVISTDFSTPQLKVKKHWNSFLTEFFIPFETLVGAIESNGSVSFDKHKYEALLDQDVACPRCKQTQPNLPRAKTHYTSCAAPIPWTPC